MSESRLNDFGKLVLRLIAGGMMLPHGIYGLTHGIDFIKTTVAEQGLPGFVAYGVYLGEFVAPVALILGLCTRASASVIFVNMLFTYFLVHSKQLLDLNEYGAFVLELNYFYSGVTLALMLIGGGNLVLAPARWRRF